MDTDNVATDQIRNRLFSITRMTYALCGALILYGLFGFLAWFLLKKAQAYPLELLRFSRFWLQGANLAFVVAMVAATLPYSPKRQLFSWPADDQKPVAGTQMGLLWGVIGGASALALASPVFWLGHKQLGPITLLVADAMSLVGLLELLLVILALAISSEVVFRGVVFRTLALHASVPAAVVASCFLFVMVCPVFTSYPAAIILGVVAAVLFYRTRNLLASIVANVLFTLGGAAIMLYRGFMQS